MRILIIEDNPKKSEQIQGLIKSSLPDDSYVLETVAAINDAIMVLARTAFDLVIADLVLPQIRGSDHTCDATAQWCDFIESEGSVRLSTWVVMTSYSDIVESARETFARYGVAVVEYSEDSYWTQILEARLIEHYVNRPLDFVVICALQKERNGYNEIDGLVLGQYNRIAGLDCRSVELDRLRGAIIVLPEPGLVSAAIATTKATAVFKPKVIAMSGICAGMIGESDLGDIIVPDVSWNYQTGKIKSGLLVPELMQTPVPPQTKTLLQQISSPEFSSLLRTGLYHSELKSRSIHVSAMVSGSPVIADENEALKVATQSRKIAGLDMEVAAVYAGAHDFFNGSGAFFAAKTVVDLATGEKDDRYHEYGCVLSARFTANAIKMLSSQNRQSI